MIATSTDRTDPPADPVPEQLPTNEIARRRARGAAALPREIGGPKGPEPTRYGDWEFNGRCTDF